jgi:hypothetical protein
MPTVKCPHCAASLNAPDEYKGRKVKCTSCGTAFVLRFPRRMSPLGGSTMDLLDDDPLMKAINDPPTSVKMTIAVEPWRAAVYQQVADERFNRDLSEFARAAFDALVEKLGYPLSSSEKPKPGE